MARTTSRTASFGRGTEPRKIKTKRRNRDGTLIEYMHPCGGMRAVVNLSASAKVCALESRRTRIRLGDLVYSVGPGSLGETWQKCVRDRSGPARDPLTGAAMQSSTHQTNPLAMDSACAGGLLADWLARSGPPPRRRARTCYECGETRNSQRVWSGRCRWNSRRRAAPGERPESEVRSARITLPGEWREPENVRGGASGA
jgi:hypothetical protein